MDWMPLKPWLPLIGAALGALLVALLVVFRWRERGPVELQMPDDPALDVRQRTPQNPPSEGPRVEVYGVPVRIDTLVLAPVGRGTTIEQRQLPEIVEQLLPGLYDVLSYHRPQFCLWEHQLSAAGFQTQFFSQLHLPGDRGKNSPWAAIAGRFSADGRPLMAGIVFSTQRANGLGQLNVSHEGQWLDAIRIRRGQSRG